MSYCRKDGKDEIIFITKNDFRSQETPPNPLLPGGEEGDTAVGLIKDNGEINWECPCLQGMAEGPCGEQFKEAFSCFHYSDAEPKGVDCLEQFKGMQECFVKYPEIYGSLDDDLKESETESERTTEIESNNLNENSMEPSASDFQTVSDSHNQNKEEALPSEEKIAVTIERTENLVKESLTETKKIK